MSFKDDTRPVWATDEEYVEKKGAVCPNCGDDMIEGDFVETGNGVAQQCMSCWACGAEWDGICVLKGYL